METFEGKRMPQVLCPVCGLHDFQMGPPPKGFHKNDLGIKCRKCGWVGSMLTAASAPQVRAHIRCDRCEEITKLVIDSLPEWEKLYAEGLPYPCRSCDHHQTVKWSDFKPLK